MEENLVDLLRDRSGRALKAGHHDMTYDELLGAAEALARQLREAGLSRGDVVSVLLPNSPGFVVTYLACWHAGIVANPLNLRQSSEEITAVLEHAGSKLVVTCEELEDQARAGAETPGVSVLVIEADRPVSAVASTKEASVAGGDLPAVLIYTSGTTAAPKGVLLSHANLLADARGLATRLGVDETYRTTCFMPLFHCNALIFSHLTTFAVGGSVQLLRKFSVSRLWDQVQEFGSHSFSCPPTVLAMLLERRSPDRVVPRSLRFVKVGAAPLAESLAHAFEEAFGLPLIEGYGMTEATATTVMHDPRVGRPSGTVGHCLEGQEVRIVDEHGQALPHGQVGEIQIGGATVMLGYHRDPEATSRAMDGRWLRSGDLGVLDELGNLALAGRRKELIIRGGENIFPVSLDHVLESHPEVSEGAAYGIPDPIWGESPAAVVVGRDGDVDLTELHDFVRSRVADFAVPVAYRVVSSIPRNAVGKIRRHELTRTHIERTKTSTT